MSVTSKKAAEEFIYGFRAHDYSDDDDSFENKLICSIPPPYKHAFQCKLIRAPSTSFRSCFIQAHYDKSKHFSGNYYAKNNCREYA